MSSSFILFGSRLSPFVEKVARALELKRQSFELVEPTNPFQFGQWNPQTRKMPVLDIDGERIGDSTFILRRLDEVIPKPPLVSPIAVVAAAQRQLEDWSDESLYWYAMAIRWSPDNAAAAAAQVTAGLPAAFRLVGSILIPRQLHAATIAQGLGRLPADVLLREFAGHLDDLVELLADKPFFYARLPSVADLAIYGQLKMLRSGPTPEAAEVIENRQPLIEFMQRLEAAAQA